MLGMETITNKEVNVRLDNEKGTLCLTGLLAGTMVLLSSIIRALGDSKTPFWFLLFAAVLNIILDLFCILVLDWGVAGAAIATVFSQGLSANYIFRDIKKGLSNKFLFNNFTPIRVQTNSDRSDFQF